MATDPVSRESVRELLRELIRIPSVNPVLAPQEAHGEAAIATFARDWLAERGLRARLEEAAPGRPNVVAQAGGDRGPALVFCAHLDTVGTAGMTIDPFDPRCEDGRVYGRGSYDMKCGLAAAMAAGAELARSGLDGSLSLALVCDEEHASLGARHYVEHHRADAAILTEPSEGRLILAHKGFVWAAITTRGRAAHGSRWDLGRSAIAGIGPVVTALEGHDREELRRRTHPLLGPASLHCARIVGGSGLSTYAAECRLEVERRTLPGEDGARVLGELRQVVARTGRSAEVELLLERPPLTTSPDAPIARAVREAARQVTGREPEDAGVGYWMDASIFAAAGIPAVNIGPAGAGAHEAVEWAELDSVVTCARVLVAAARRFCTP